MYDFEKVLVKPNIEPFDTNTQRIRRNLMAASIVIFIFSIASDGVDTNSTSIAGIKFVNLQPEYLQLILLASLFYFIVHFVWAALDHLKSNTLRLTGIAIPKVNEVGGFIGIDTLFPNTDDENQTSLYSWWSKFAKQPLHIEQQIKNITDKNENEDYEEALKKIDTKLVYLQYKTSYINEALIRFEKGFWHYQRSQLLRWLFLDFGIPFSMGAVSFCIAFYNNFLVSC